MSFKRFFFKIISFSHDFFFIVGAIKFSFLYKYLVSRIAKSAGKSASSESDSGNFNHFDSDPDSGLDNILVLRLFKIKRKHKKN